MRIVGGRFRGKRLQSPRDKSVRPTSDRVRESLFNILDHHNLVVGARFLDLFCGTGAVGLEAYSRGATDVWLMDQDITLATVNIRAFDHPTGISLFHQRDLDKRNGTHQFDVAFLDPPYGKNLIAPTLLKLRRHWLTASSWIVAEHSSKEDFEIPAGFFLRDTRCYGRVHLAFLGIDLA